VLPLPSEGEGWGEGDLQKVFVEQAGRLVSGAVRIKDGPAAKQLVEQLRMRIREE